MTDSKTHPELSEIPAEEQDGIETLGRVDEVIDPHRPMTPAELEEHDERSRVEETLDQLGPTRISERPIITIFLPMAVKEVGTLLLAVGDAFPNCTTRFDTDCLHIYR